MTKVEARVKEMRELQRMAEELQAEITTIQDEIKQEMTEQNVDELVAGEYKIRWAEVISKRFDTTAFKNKYQDLYSQYVKESVTRRFSVA